MLPQFGLESLDSKFFSRRIGGFEQSIRVKSKHISFVRDDLSGCKLGIRKNAHREIRALELRYLVRFGGKVQNGRVARKTKVQTTGMAVDKTKSDKHIRVFQRIEDLVQPRLQMQTAFGGTQQHPSGALDHACDDSGCNSVARHIGDIGDPARFRARKIDQVAAHLTAWRRVSVELKTPELRVNGRDQHTMNFRCEFYLGVHAEVPA